MGNTCSTVEFGSAAIHAAVHGVDLEQTGELNGVRLLRTAVERHRLTCEFSVCAGQGVGWTALAE